MTKYYYSIPSNNKGNFGSMKFTRKNEAIADAKREYKEMVRDGYSDGSLRVDVFEGTEDDYFADRDTVFTIKDE